MRSFATILTALSLPLYAFSAHHGEHVRRHADLALRARGDIAERGGDRFTYYDITTGQVACSGYFHTGDFVVALNSAQFAGGSHCFASISISYGDVTLQAQIVDECPGCPVEGLDLTEGLFSALAGSLTAGVIYGSWNFGGSGSAPKEDPTTTTPKYTPPPTTSTQQAYTPPPKTHTTTTPPPPPPSSSTSTSKTSSSALATSPSSSYKPHSSTTPTATSASSVSSSNATPGPLAQPAGTLTNDGGPENLQSLFNFLINCGDVVLAS